ncbi:Uncharacterised protein [Sphingobacterium multivorum]|uniref:Uncharacterized protein n=1 Tax=Sphingobacterium multivorum TaxID=28454 RepID=A0A654C019_SPHMU|nr:Uncharacterised protein [Sphingobacterium multivorum]VXC85227.1 conserved hypothetical protein [Sphingobacterium multivorum]HAE67526.1 hypothetical protein [Sphingobacterium sp.]
MYCCGYQLVDYRYLNYTLTKPLGLEAKVGETIVRKIADFSDYLEDSKGREFICKLSSREANNEYAFSFEPIRFLNRLNMYNWQYKEWPNLSMELKVLLAG